MGDIERGPEQAANGLAGAMGASAGVNQGHIGSLTGQMAGPQEGMNRFAMGGMEGGSLAELIRAIFPMFAAGLGQTIAAHVQPQAPHPVVGGVSTSPQINPPTPFGEGAPVQGRGFGGLQAAPQPAPSGMGQPRSPEPTRRMVL